MVMQRDFYIVPPLTQFVSAVGNAVGFTHGYFVLPLRGLMADGGHDNHVPTGDSKRSERP